MFYTIQLSIHNFHHRLSKKDFIPPKKMAQTTSTLRDHKGPKVFCDFETGENHHREAWKVIPQSGAGELSRSAVRTRFPNACTVSIAFLLCSLRKCDDRVLFSGSIKKDGKWEPENWQSNNPPANTTRNRWRPTVHLATLRWLGLFGSVSGWALYNVLFFGKKIFSNKWASKYMGA